MKSPPSAADPFVGSGSLSSRQVIASLSPPPPSFCSISMYYRLPAWSGMRAVRFSQASGQPGRRSLTSHWRSPFDVGSVAIKTLLAGLSSLLQAARTRGIAKRTALDFHRDVRMAHLLKKCKRLCHRAAESARTISPSFDVERRNAQRRRSIASRNYPLPSAMPVAIGNARCRAAIGGKEVRIQAAS